MLVWGAAAASLVGWGLALWPTDPTLLANTVGNMLNRTSAMARRWFDGTVPPAGVAQDPGHPLAEAASAAISTVLPCLETLDFRGAAEASLHLAIAANGFLNTQAPWSLMKKEGNTDQVASDLYAVLEAARLVALLLGPLVPELSARMLQQLALQPLGSGPDDTNAIPWLEQLQWGQLAVGSPLPEPAPVMARLELDGPL